MRRGAHPRLAFREPFDLHQSFAVISLAEIGSAVGLVYAHYFADVMAATFLWVMMECAWERVSAPFGSRRL